MEETRSKTIENSANAQYNHPSWCNVQSDTDLKNLGYVEQETGVKQARDAERIEAQAKSQTQD